MMVGRLVRTARLDGALFVGETMLGVVLYAGDVALEAATGCARY